MKPVQNEIRLWRAVLDQVLFDVQDADEEIRSEAIDWTSFENEEFLVICDHACIDPEMVHKVVHLAKDGQLPKLEDQDEAS